jgi:GNAT superfamily N-acetyltransferase
VDGEGIEPLREEDAGKVDEYWGLARDYREFFARRIRDGPAWGLRQNGELIAWVGTYYVTDRVAQLGYLHVMEEHRRKGIARRLTIWMIQDVRRRGLVPTFYIFKTNDPSLGLAGSMGSVKLDEQSWMGGTFKGL